MSLVSSGSLAVGASWGVAVVVVVVVEVVVVVVEGGLVDLGGARVVVVVEVVELRVVVGGAVEDGLPVVEGGLGARVVVVCVRSVVLVGETVVVSVAGVVGKLKVSARPFFP